MAELERYLPNNGEPTGSEAELDRCYIRCGIPGGVLVKLSWHEYTNLVTHPAFPSAAKDDFQGALRALYLNPAESFTDTHISYLKLCREATKNGGLRLRFHAQARNKEESSESGLPDVTAPVQRVLGLVFAADNEPLGGEKVLYVPPEIEAVVGMRGLENEVHLMYEDYGRVFLGAMALHYNPDFSVKGRTILQPEHKIAQVAHAVYQGLLDATDDSFVVPALRPPQSIEEHLGMQAVDDRWLMDNAASFRDIIPPALR